MEMIPPTRVMMDSVSVWACFFGEKLPRMAKFVKCEHLHVICPATSDLIIVHPERRGNQNDADNEHTNKQNTYTLCAFNEVFAYER